jgi:hypothetical protein
MRWEGAPAAIKCVDDTIVWLEKARNANPAHPNIRVDLPAAYGLNLKGETKRAAAELAEARRLRSDGLLAALPG